MLIMASATFAVFVGLSRLYLLVRGRHGLGQGDAKLFAAAAAWLGLAALPTVVALAATAALATVAAASLRAGAVTASTRLPFGPYIALAFWIVWLHGPIVAGAIAAGPLVVGQG